MFCSFIVNWAKRKIFLPFGPAFLCEENSYNGTLPSFFFFFLVSYLRPYVKMVEISRDFCTDLFPLSVLRHYFHFPIFFHAKWFFVVVALLCVCEVPGNQLWARHWRTKQTEIRVFCSFVSVGCKLSFAPSHLSPWPSPHSLVLLLFSFSGNIALSVCND